MDTVPSDLKVKAPKERKPRKKKEEKEPKAPKEKKPRKKKVKGVFKVEQGTFIVVFD
jgi:hypothetical protein